MTDIQYKQQAAKGLTVIYGKERYRIQDDGKGWLHIVVKKKKIGIDRVLLFDYGTKQDWIFNEWHTIYPDPKVFEHFANAELAWINN